MTTDQPVPTGQPGQPDLAAYVFCEPVTATTLSREHIRRLGPEGTRPGGGIPREHATTLCGYDVTGGWDNPGAEVTEPAVTVGVTAEVNPVCTGCADAWRAATTPAAPAATCAVPGCQRNIRLIDGRWLDDSADPAFCPHSRDLHHRPE